MLKKLFLLLLVPCLVQALDYSPWFNRVLDFEGKLKSSAQGGKKAALYRDEVSLKVTPWNNIRTELEVDLFASNTHTYSFEALKFAAQYAFLDDVSGDPITLVTGATFILPTTRARNEYNLFYPGSTEVELHLILGKELYCDDTAYATYWNNRVWLDVGYGLANTGSPWWRTHSQADWNLFKYGEASLFIETVVGSQTKFYTYGGIYAYRLARGGTLLLTLRHTLLLKTYPALME